MPLRDCVINQILHKETHPVPYTLPMEEGVSEGLDRYYGSSGWRERILPHGTPAQLRAEIKRLVSELGRGGGYILAPTKGLMEGMPIENAAAIVEAFTVQE